ncbi:hypothetical protein KQX54_002277 [Cotesia glomerata]|uniref:Uncharacterized protein n=1 Tax=Cotesia glomerata TaxID=32391 RepID=A0AAV7ITX5_COTGL|nr:hypothetical protein KQX54_002277 [Cotesia glomerata]
MRMVQPKPYNKAEVYSSLSRSRMWPCTLRFRIDWPSSMSCRSKVEWPNLDADMQPNNPPVYPSKIFPVQATTPKIKLNGFYV